MTDDSATSATGGDSERLGDAEPPIDGAGLDDDPDRAAQHASADVAPELFGW